MAPPTDLEAVALLSGGLDSTVAMALAHLDVGVAVALCVNYGQRTYEREFSASTAICERLGIHPPRGGVSVDVYEGLRLGGGGKLLEREGDAPPAKAGDAPAKAWGGEDMDFWVPNRNGILLNIGAGVAEAEGLAYVVVGFNVEEAEFFPDNSRKFMESANSALAYSTRNKVTVISPTLEMTKREIVEAGLSVGAPLELIYSCYRGEVVHCGRCPNCRRLVDAFRGAGAYHLIERKFEG